MDIPPLSLITQFLITSPAVYVPNSLVHVPITNGRIKDYVVENIIHYFKKIQYVYDHGCLQKIQMQHIPDKIQEMIKCMIQSNDIHPIIEELFVSKKFNKRIVTNNINGSVRKYQVQKVKVRC